MLQPLLVPKSITRGSNTWFKGKHTLSKYSKIDLNLNQAVDYLQFRPRRLSKKPSAYEARLLAKIYPRLLACLPTFIFRPPVSWEQLKQKILTDTLASLLRWWSHQISANRPQTAGLENPPEELLALAAELEEFELTGASAPFLLPSKLAPQKAS